MKTFMTPLFLLTAFIAAEAKEFTFDRELSGWKKNYAPSVAFDPAEKVSPSGSFRMTANPKYPCGGSTILELQPDRRYLVSFMAKGENIADNRTGLFANAGKKWERIGSRLSGTFAWTKHTGILDTGKMGSAKVTLHITLFGKEGKLWIDRLSIVPESEVIKQNLLLTEQGGFYKNPDYHFVKKADGSLRLLLHEINGSFTPAGKHDGHPVIRVKSAYLKSWDMVVAVVWQQTFRTMEPGRYTFSVNYCSESEIRKIGMFMKRTPAGAKKGVSIFRKYDISELAKPGVWTEIAINFEVKPGDTDLNFFYCFRSTEPATVLFSDPKIEKDED